MGWNYTGPRGPTATNTDTILYVSVVGDEVTLIAIPRDLYLEPWQTKHQRDVRLPGRGGAASHRRRGARAARSTTTSIINLDIFENVVDALGGVEVNVPYRMRYVDVAGGLDIDLFPVRRSWTANGRRISSATARPCAATTIASTTSRRLAYAMLQRVRDLNVRAVTAAPRADRDGASPTSRRTPAPRSCANCCRAWPGCSCRSATLPTVRDRRDSALLLTDRARSRPSSPPPSAAPRATGPSPGRDAAGGRPLRPRGPGEAYVDALVAMGIPEAQLVIDRRPRPTRRAPAWSPSPTHWCDADYFAELLGVGKQQIDRLPFVAGRAVGMQLVSVEDAPDPFPSPERLASPRSWRSPTPRPRRERGEGACVTEARSAARPDPPTPPCPTRSKLIVDALDDKRAKDIAVLHLEEVSETLDWFVVATGESSLQLQAHGGRVRERLKAARRPAQGRRGPLGPLDADGLRRRRRPPDEPRGARVLRPRGAVGRRAARPGGRRAERPPGPPLGRAARARRARGRGWSRSTPTSRSRGGELDLVMQDGGARRLRRGAPAARRGAFGGAAASLDARKQAQGAARGRAVARAPRPPRGPGAVRRRSWSTATSPPRRLRHVRDAF